MGNSNETSKPRVVMVCEFCLSAFRAFPYAVQCSAEALTQLYQTQMSRHMGEFFSIFINLHSTAFWENISIIMFKSVSRAVQFGSINIYFKDIDV